MVKYLFYSSTSISNIFNNDEDSDEDLFATKKTLKPKSKVEAEASKPNKVSLFQDDDKTPVLESSETEKSSKRSETKKLPTAVNEKAKSIFDSDSDSDLFVKPKTKLETKKSFTEAKRLFEDNDGDELDGNQKSKPADNSVDKETKSEKAVKKSTDTSGKINSEIKSLTNKSTDPAMQKVGGKVKSLALGLKINPAALMPGAKHAKNIKEDKPAGEEKENEKDSTEVLEPSDSKAEEALKSPTNIFKATEDSKIEKKDETIPKLDSPVSPVDICTAPNVPGNSGDSWSLLVGVAKVIKLWPT